MTIPEIKKKWTAILLDLLYKQSAEKDEFDKKLYNPVVTALTDVVKDLDKIECNGKVIDYVKETCTSCNCENHKTE